jgi:hypothetical protein
MPCNNHKLDVQQKYVCCHFLHLFKRQIKHRTNPDKVQTEITLTQTYETIQTTTQQLSVTIDSKMKIMMNYNYLLTIIHHGKELYSTLSCKKRLKHHPIEN